MENEKHGRDADGNPYPLPSLPDWVVYLKLAERWGIPPWEVEEAPYLWIVRQIENDSIENSFNRVKKNAKTSRHSS